MIRERTESIHVCSFNYPILPESPEKPAIPADGADFALRSPGIAAHPPVGDQDIREIPPLLLRERSHQVPLYHADIVRIRKSDPLGKPPDMRIYCNALVSPECMVEHNVCGFPAYPGIFRSSSMVSGTLPSNSDNRACEAAMMCFALA